MENIKTGKGTILPILNLKGKPYLQVPHRIVWFREEKPNWLIQVDFIERNDNFVLAKAQIFNDENKLMAVAHKVEHYGHFADALEKAETGSIGRALALIGYGTQFATEVYEDERLVDTPISAKKNKTEFKTQEPKKTEEKKQQLPVHPTEVIGQTRALSLLENICKPGIWTREHVMAYAKSVLKKELKDLTGQEAMDFFNLTKTRDFEELTIGQSNEKTT